MSVTPPMSIYIVFGVSNTWFQIWSEATGDASETMVLLPLGDIVPIYDWTAKSRPEDLLTSSTAS